MSDRLQRKAAKLVKAVDEHDCLGDNLPARAAHIRRVAEEVRKELERERRPLRQKVSLAPASAVCKRCGGSGQIFVTHEGVAGGYEHRCPECAA